MSKSAIMDLGCQISRIKDIIAARHLARFAMRMMPGIQMTRFHETYYELLNAFAHGKIKRLIVTVPPQHGKSLGASQFLAPYILGLNPNAQIAIASYAFSLATTFNRRVQRVIQDASYSEIFPKTKLKNEALDKDLAKRYVQTSEVFEIIGYDGCLRSVGRGGGLTGNRVDIAIIDDLYKDAMEANSPTTRANTWEWYNSVLKTRLHNNSSELIVFTRWHEEDIIGTLEGLGLVKEITSLSDIKPGDDCYYKVNFEAIKESEPTELDPRTMGEPLWAEMHGLSTLNDKRKLDHLMFDCLYQGRPGSKEGLLYGDNFKTYTELPATIKKSNYTDTADTGSDKLCSICYEVGSDGLIYITDVLYTSEPMEVTEGATAQMLLRNNTRGAYVESNNGGRGFARAVGKLVPHVRIEWFHQSQNKESRVLTNSATVLHKIVFPTDWRLRWTELYKDITTYKRIFRANKHDDAPDVLTGIIEREVLRPKNNGIRRIAY